MVKTMRIAKCAKPHNAQKILGSTHIKGYLVSSHNLYRWAKGKHFYNFILENVNFYWWSVYSFKFYVPRWANKSGSLPKKKKGLWDMYKTNNRYIKHWEENVGSRLGTMWNGPLGFRFILDSQVFPFFNKL